MLGQTLIFIGLVIAAVGLLIMFAPHFGSCVGKLPGDFSFQSGNVKFYFPLATSLLLSLVLTVVLNLLARR